MKRKYLSLRNVQLEELNILRETIKFLDENSINYYICYGTLLGAVRHKGFIPWDDDIDIVIKRDEYNKFIKLVQEKNNILCKDMKVIGWEIDKSDFPFLKVVNMNICAESDNQCDTYLWVDIFPLDNIPENPRIYFSRLMYLRNIYCLKRIENRKLNKKSRNKLRGLLKIIITNIYIKFLSLDDIMDKYIKYCKKYNNKKTKYLFNNAWGFINKSRITSEMINGYTMYQFENMEVKSFNNPEKFLSGCYGLDYMKLPPENKRIIHGIKAWKREDEND